MSDTSSLTTSIDCVDSANCLITEYGRLSNHLRVLKSTNGGRSFELSWSEKEWYFDIPEIVYYLDSARAYITSGFSMILRSNDGGAQWDTVGRIANVYWENFTPIHFRTPDSAIVLRNGADVDTLFRTTDGWQTWTKEAIPEPWIDPRSQTPEHAYEFANGRLSISWNRTLGLPVTFGTKNPTTGEWRYTEIIDSGWVASDMVALSESTYICSLWGPGWHHSAARSVICRSVDYGETWEVVFDKAVADSAIIIDLDFRDSLNGIATTRGVVLRTTDGGDTWAAESFEPTPSQFNHVSVSYPPGSNGVLLQGRGAEMRVWVAEPTGSVQSRAEQLNEIGISDVRFSPEGKGAMEDHRLIFNSEKWGPVTIRFYDVLGREWYRAEHVATKGLNSLNLSFRLPALQMGFVRLESKNGVATVPVWIGQ